MKSQTNKNGKTSHGVAAFAQETPDLVCFSHLRWNFVYQRPQHLLSRCAQERRVFFIEEAIVGEGSARLTISRPESNLTVVVPHLPATLTPQAINEAQQTLLNELFAQEHIHTYISWYYTPMALNFTRHLQPVVVVYDCMDELTLFKGASPALKKLEVELFSRADVVFTGGQSLYEVKRNQHPHVHAFPSSIDVAHFAQARTLKDEPADQVHIPHPRLGFFGVIDERMDIELIARLAEARPDWHLVIVGPVAKIDAASLPRHPNIHYLGAKSYQELPAYLAGWDVALLPFARNDATRFISPTKTPEYLAGGKPAVSTAIQDVVQPYGEQGLVYIAHTAAEFEAAIGEILARTSEERAAWLQQVDQHLAEKSWDHTWAQMAQLIQAALDTYTLKAPQPSLLDRSVMSLPVSRPQVTVNINRSGGVKTFDYLIVGAGFAGSVLAERLADGAGKKVLVIDKRPHIAGNAFDHYNREGVLVHKYGPHIFHTNSREVFDYLSRFTQWRPYEHRVRANVDGQLVPIPINLDTINQLYGLNLTSFQVEEFFASLAEPREQIRTSEDVVVSKVGKELYEKFFRNYTRKQWDLDPSELDSSVIARVPIRTNRDDRYFTDTYQAMPLYGYTHMFENILDHPNIKVMLNTDFKEIRDYVSYNEIIYTGPIDEFFDYCYGKLPYRSLNFKFETLDTPLCQPVAVINYPNQHLYTRVTEFKHLTGQEHSKTSLVYEYPCAEGDPYYPIPRPENMELYRKYKALADATPQVHFVGRLGTYKYYNMDQVTAQALTMYSKINGVRRAEPAKIQTQTQVYVLNPTSPVAAAARAAG
ncbi:MAG: UDP-galactopyranose mutase [Anaerolineae bacterium]